MRRFRYGWLSLLIIALTGCSAGSGSPSGAHMPTVHQDGGMAPRMTARYRLAGAGYAVAIAVDGNGLWLALHSPPNGVATAAGPGQVQHVDAATGAVLAQWPVGAVPVAIAADGQSVWVADGPGIGPGTAPGGDQVLQFGESGNLAASYPVTNPISLAVQDGAAVVAYQVSSAVFVQLLSSGASGPPVKLAAAGRSAGATLAWCPDRRLWAASYDDRAQQIHLQQIVTEAGQPLPAAHSDTVLAASGTMTLACQPGGLAALVTDLDHATLFMIPNDAPATPVRSARLPPARGVTGDARQLWLIGSAPFPDQTAQVELLNASNLTTGPPAPVPGGVSLYTAAGARAWLVNADQQAPQVGILTVIATP